jgi:hypothetical protein
VYLSKSGVLSDICRKSVERSGRTLLMHTIYDAKDSSQNSLKNDILYIVVAGRKQTVNVAHISTAAVLLLCRSNAVLNRKGNAN